MSCCDTLSEKNNQLRIDNIELKSKEFDLELKVLRLQKEVRKQSNIIGVINDLVYDDGSYNLTWNEFNEIMEMKRND